MAAVLKLVPGLVGRVETVLQVISKVKPLLAIVKMEMKYVMVILLLLLRLVSSGQKRIIARQDKLFWSIRKMDCNVKTIKTIPIVKIMKYDFAAQVSSFNSLSELQTLKFLTTVSFRQCLHWKSTQLSRWCWLRNNWFECWRFYLFLQKWIY